MVTTIMWAGKALPGAEEVRLRRLVHTLRRIGKDELADDFERFLPEREEAWTLDERMQGAQVGPRLRVDGSAAGGSEQRSA